MTLKMIRICQTNRMKNYFLWITAALFCMQSCKPPITASDHDLFLDCTQEIERSWDSKFGKKFSLIEVTGAGLPKKVVINISVESLLVENHPDELEKLAEEVEKMLQLRMENALRGISIEVEVTMEN